MPSDKLFHGGWKGKFKLDNKNSYFSWNRPLTQYDLMNAGFKCLQDLREFMAFSKKEKTKRYNCNVVAVVKAFKELEKVVNFYISKIQVLTKTGKSFITMKSEWNDLTKEQQDKDYNEFKPKADKMLGDLIDAHRIWNLEVMDRSNSKVALYLFKIEFHRMHKEYTGGY